MSDTNDNFYDPTVIRGRDGLDSDKVDSDDSIPSAHTRTTSDSNSDFSSTYLRTLYSDFKSKIHSADIYLQRIRKQQDNLNQIIEEWTSDLKSKYSALDSFSKSRPRTTIPGDFAIEDQTASGSNQQSKDLKKIDSSITDNSEQINYSFNKLDDYLKFLGQTYYDAQDTLNKIYDRFMEIYDNM